jgi:hypothetical protein
MSTERHGIRITSDTIDLVTFLNDGVRPEINEDNFLIIEVNGPREITTHVMTLKEYNAAIHDGKFHQLL